MLTFMLCIILATSGIAAVSGYVIGHVIGWDAGWDARSAQARQEIADQEWNRITILGRHR